MSRQNRVTPFGTLIATPARGTRMGNRGCLHDAAGRIVRGYRGKRWIICLLDFKGRRRRVMTPGRYTELFFLDEATALTAGHRPCAECQRTRFHQFRKTWAAANPHLVKEAPSATTLDDFLHRERLVPWQERVDKLTGRDKLPDGVHVTPDGQLAYLVLGERLLRWTPDGYVAAPAPAKAALHVLTPLSIVRTLAAGFPAHIHPSAWSPV